MCLGKSAGSASWLGEEGKAVVLFPSTCPDSILRKKISWNGSWIFAQQYHVPAGMIGFELTRSIFFENHQINRVGGCHKRMHELGFACSLDDFGSGFSSLGLLKGI